jgi:hypothetical protein
MALQDPMTTDVKTIVDAAHGHIIGGHHNMDQWSWDNLPPEATMNYDDVDGIGEAGEELMSERLADHLHGVKDAVSKKK